VVLEQDHALGRRFPGKCGVGELSWRRIRARRRGLRPERTGQRQQHDHRLYSGADEPPNICRFVFLDAQAPAFFVDWERSADQCVAVLRSQTGRAPDDRGLSQLVDELNTLSAAFRALWASHDGHFHDTGIKRIHHPVVGDLRLPFNRREVSADRGLTILAYSAEPGSREAQALELLGAWTASGV
jgi:hypothetical protein